MVTRQVTGWALLAGATAGGLALGYLAERKVMGAQRPGDDPEWAALHAPLPTTARIVASADGTRLHVVEAGPPSAPTLVLAHGYGLGSRFWQHQILGLSRDLRVVAYDQRGHGRSDRAVRRDYSVRALGADLHAVLRAVLAPGQRAVVAGHSMGGMSVMAYAEGFPDEVERQLAGAALLATGAARLFSGSAFSTGIAALGAFEQRLGSRVFGRQVPGGDTTSDLSYLLTRAIGLSPGASPAHVAFVEQLLIEMPKEAKAAFAQTLGSLDLSAALAHLRVPTVVVVGARDRLTPLSQAKALTDALPQATFVELPDVGHHLPLEAHEAVNAILREHVRAAFAGRGGAGGAPPTRAPRRPRRRRAA